MLGRVRVSVLLKVPAAFHRGSGYGLENAGRMRPESPCL